MKGFTLLELLISMVVLATIMALLYGAYGSTVDTVQFAREQGEMSQSARMILERMSMELQSAAPSNSGPLVGERDEIGGRHADRIGFNTFYGRGEYEAADLFRRRYQLADNSEEDGMILSCLEEAVVTETLSIGIRSVELSGMIAELEITYQDEEGRKFDQWNSGEGGHLSSLPFFISIRLTMRAPTGREQTFTTGVHPELAGS